MNEKYPVELGFYYHYKHDPQGPMNHYAYEVVGFGHHTEVEGLYESAMVIYRPLYKDAGVYKEGKHADLRPLAMFVEKVEKDGKVFDRFTKITDEHVIHDLEIIKSEMYGE